MALSRVKVWQAGDVLTATDLNAEINNLINNGQSLVQPWVGTFDLDGNTLVLDGDADTSIDCATDDTIDITIAGADDFRLTANTFTALSGSSIAVTNGNITSTAGNLTITDGATSLADADTRTNTVATPLTISAETSGTPAAGIGTGILFRAESGDEAPSNFGQVEFVASDVTAASEDTYFQVLLRVAGAALTACYRFVATGAFKAIFTHANSADRTYTLPNFDGTIATLAGTEGLSNKTVTASSFDNTNTFTACIKTTSLASATGSASVNAADLDVTMNDYSFFPSMTATNGNDRWAVQPVHSTADPSNTTGRFYLTRTASDGLPTVTVRWRYITASDDPTIWLAYDPGTGQIVASWASDDPTPDGSPGVRVHGMTSIRLKAQQLEHLTVLNARASEAMALIRDKRLRQQHEAYRALQLHANDDAPARWLLENCTVNLATGLLRMQR